MTVHLRQKHTRSMAPYPACLFMVDFVQGTTTKDKAKVDCPHCKKLMGFQL